MKYWILAVALWFLAIPAHAQTGTFKTKQALQAEIASCFPDQSTGAITPQVMRQCTLDFVASWQQGMGVNSQPGNSYTVQLSDNGQTITTTAASPVAVTLPTASAPTGFYPFSFWITPIGIGTITVTPVSGTIGGQTSLTLTTNQAAIVTSDGTNWQAVNFSGGTAINIAGGPAGALGYYATTGTTISPLGACPSGVYTTTAGSISQCVTTLPSMITYPSPIFTGTVTGPDSGLWDTNGIHGPAVGEALVSNTGMFTNLGFLTLSPSSLQESPITITGLAANNSPNTSNDFLPYFSAADGKVRKITIGSVAAAATAGVTNVNGIVSDVTLIGSGGLTVSPISHNIDLIVASTPGGRLTLTTGTPVMTATQANASTIFYDCFHGANRVPVWNGTIDVSLAIGACEISTVLQSSSTGVINTAGVFDVWAVNVSSTLTLCVATNGSGGGWASDTAGSNTARGTGYSQLDTTTRPQITNANALTNCYNGSSNEGTIAANHATYLGTFYSTSAGQTSFTFGTTSSVAGLFGLWNAYNRVPVTSLSWLSTSSWTHNVVSTWRQANNNAAAQARYVYGLNEDGVASTTVDIVAPNADTCLIAVGVDSTTVPSGAQGGINGTGLAVGITGAYSGYPGIGLHTIASLEFTNSANNCTFTGNGQGGISVQLRM